jgi:type I restriction enzyme, S subunit
MVEFQTIRIADFGRVVTGKTPPSAQPELFGDLYPFLTPTDIDGSARHIESGRFLSAAGRDYQHRLMLPSRAVCVVCIGATIGKVCMTDRPSFTNQQINSVVVNEGEHNPFFVYHLLSTLRDELKSNAGGAATPIINKTAFSEIKVSVPPLPVQQRIAGILSAYDELIENSQRRIKVLEAMARALYREWFDHFRFLGHENHPRVASPLGDIPQGWEVKKLGDLADISWGDTSTTKASYVEEGYAAYSASGSDGKLDHYDFDRTGIVLSAIGAQCGKTWIASGKWSCIKNTIRFWSKDERASTEFLFIATEGQDFWPRRGAAQPFISQGDAERINVLTPDRATMKRFTKFASAFLGQIATLQTQIQNLRRTRDLLLPRLLSGQI